MNDTPASKLSAPFTEMAARIDKNDGEQFGGAFVVVPPAGAGEPMQGLMFNSGTDLAAFWMLLQAQINSALEQLKQQNQNPYGRPR